MSELLEKLSKVVSAGGLISGDALTERDFPGANLPIALVRPKSTEEVAQINVETIASKRPTTALSSATDNPAV